MTGTMAAKTILGPRLTATMRCLMRGYARPRWGNLRRTTPFSTHYGFERGTPIDRYYLHAFLEACRPLITGAALEVQGTSYTQRYGINVRTAESFDIAPAARPTYVCDLADCDDVLPAAAFDCLLLPNTLQHLQDLDRCLAQAWRIVRPGGAIVASAAGLTPLTGDVADYWRLTPDGWRERLGRAWRGGDLRVDGYGNCLAAIAAQMGLACEELTRAELDARDPRYPVLTTIVCKKPVAVAHAEG
jgi:SAM-dependent methyltransferase